MLSAQRSYLRVRPFAFSGRSILKTIVYIDGFKLYYAIRSYNHKWLNVKQLADNVLPAPHQVVSVKYYTARVSGAADPGQPRRQQIYLKALQMVPEIEIFFGKFLAKTVWRPLMNLPAANRPITIGGSSFTFPAGDYPIDADPAIFNTRREILAVGSYPAGYGNGQPKQTPAPNNDAIKAQVHWMEEKGSDVNLACHLVNDAWAGKFEAAAVISNDTDLAEPIRIVTQELNKPIILICPSKFGASPHLQKFASSVRHIHFNHVRSSQFPSPIPGTTIEKPDSW